MRARNMILCFISWYQRLVSSEKSPLRVIFPNSGHCRFQPTCSVYTYEAVSRYGIIKGLLLGGHRIVRCHPWSPGGYDPVPQKR